MTRSAGHWIALGGAGAALLAFVVLATVLTPSPAGHGTHEQLGLPACAAMEHFGVPCPGCGITTSAALAVRGELRRAFLTQPFGPVVVLAGLAWIPWAAAGHLLGRDLGRDLARLARKSVLIPLGAAFAAAWVYKLWITLA